MLIFPLWDDNLTNNEEILDLYLDLWNQQIIDKTIKKISFPSRRNSVLKFLKNLLELDLFRDKNVLHLITFLIDTAKSCNFLLFKNKSIEVMKKRKAGGIGLKVIWDYKRLFDIFSGYWDAVIFLRALLVIYLEFLNVFYLWVPPIWSP